MSVKSNVISFESIRNVRIMEDLRNAYAQAAMNAVKEVPIVLVLIKK